MLPAVAVRGAAWVETVALRVTDVRWTATGLVASTFGAGAACDFTGVLTGAAILAAGAAVVVVDVEVVLNVGAVFTGVVAVWCGPDDASMAPPTSTTTATGAMIIQGEVLFFLLIRL